jgi:hypothetical protein
MTAPGANRTQFGVLHLAQVGFMTQLANGFDDVVHRANVGLGQ